MKMIKRVLVVGSAAVLLACGDFLEVTNPGPMQDEALSVPGAVPGLVVGMSGDLSQSLRSLLYLASIAADDLAHGGSYTSPGLFWRGIILDEDVNGVWAAMHRARWVAENGIERLRGVLGAQFDANPYVARAHMLAGLANRNLGENVCHAVIDGGAPEDHKVHFQRAEGYFTEGIRIADAANHSELRRAGYGGRASVRAWLGDWQGAVADARQVPTHFVYEAIFSSNSTRERNELWQETYLRYEYTVYSTPWAEVFDDARVPWDTLYDAGGGVRLGQDGITPFFQQRKYPSYGSNVPIIKGTEMRVLEAEAALRRGELAEMTALINEQREFYEMQPIPQPANLDAAWEVLQFERGAVVWLEARRFWDLRRWYEEGWNSYLEGRDKCIPISFNERLSNVNIP